MNKGYNWDAAINYFIKRIQNNDKKLLFKMIKSTFSYEEITSLNERFYLSFVEQCEKISFENPVRAFASYDTGYYQWKNGEVIKVTIGKYLSGEIEGVEIENYNIVKYLGEK